MLLRFLQKHLSLERFHYHVATNLGLLQASITRDFNQQGAAYHWKPELLSLPVYDGVAKRLEKQNTWRKTQFDVRKKKRRRVELKRLRVRERITLVRTAWKGQEWRKSLAKRRVGESLEKNVDYTYRLCCLNGVISEIVSEKNLRAVTSARRIPLDNWRRVVLKVAQSDPRNIEEYRQLRGA